MISHLPELVAFQILPVTPCHKLSATNGNWDDFNDNLNIYTDNPVMGVLNRQA